MKFSKVFSILLISGTLLFFSCKDKENDDNPNPDNTKKTNTEYLTDSSWVLTSAEFNPPLVISLGPLIDTFYNLFEIPLYEDCDKDNRIKFNKNYTMTLDNGALKCGSEPQTANDGIWKFMNNETIIQITNSEYFSMLGQDTVMLKSITLSDTTMKGTTEYEYNNPFVGTVKSNVNFIFKK